MEKIKYPSKADISLFNKKNISFPKLNPGDAVIHNMFTFHAATNHVGKGIRWTLSSNYHKISKTPYILHENFKSDKNKNFRLEMNKPMRIPCNANYNTIA